jgi:hypothetical protein
LAGLSNVRRERSAEMDMLNFRKSDLLSFHSGALELAFMPIEWDCSRQELSLISNRVLCEAVPQ